MPIFRALAEAVKRERRANKADKTRTIAQRKESEEKERLFRKVSPLVERARRMRGVRCNVRGGRSQAIAALQDSFFLKEVTDRSIASFKAALDKIDKDFPPA